jgi:predicted nucleic acid-binding protein
MRVVLDTNVLVSGLVFGGKPLAVMEVFFSGRCELVVSEPVLKELEQKLSTKFGWRSLALSRVGVRGILGWGETRVERCCSHIIELSP